jgi:hypothetical protein
MRMLSGLELAIAKQQYNPPQRRGFHALQTGSMRALIQSWVILIGLTVGACGSAQAASPAVAAPREIAHSLDYIRNSGCRFFRNGSWYEAARAAQHLQSKYEYLLKRGEIGTAEDFVLKAGSHSSLTSRPYRVSCADRPELTTEQWLTEELARYRSTPP